LFISPDKFFIYLFFSFMNIYVGNLNYKVRENDLQEKFGAYGEVSSVKVIKDRETRRSKGFGFVEMADDSAAAKAIEELNGTDYEGRAMVVNEAKEREDHR
jgi:RNA recognition motif-containing protein